jgi:hypothetical protein
VKATVVHMPSSVQDENVEYLKTEALNAKDSEHLKTCLDALELYGYKGVPVIKDILEITSDEEIKNHCKEILARLGW